MLKLLVGILAFGALCLLLLGSMCVRIFRSLFGFGNKSAHTDKDNSVKNVYGDSSGKNKVFGEHEGEYVEFEEIDEEENAGNGGS